MRSAAVSGTGCSFGERIKERIAGFSERGNEVRQDDG